MNRLAVFVEVNDSNVYHYIFIVDGFKKDFVVNMRARGRIPAKGTVGMLKVKGTSFVSFEYDGGCLVVKE